jgi:hypothetical protein
MTHEIALSRVEFLRNAFAIVLVSVACSGSAAAQQTQAKNALPDVVVHVGDLPASVFYELESWTDPSSPGGKMVGVTNRGDELDPPPENDPNATFTVRVQAGVPYRFWVRMKVGPPKGISKANVLFVQFSGAVDASNKEILAPRSGDYLTVSGPAKEGWTWVGSDRQVKFRTSGDITVRVQAGAEGVGFDQLVLSPGRFLQSPPAESIVRK